MSLLSELKQIYYQIDSLSQREKHTKHDEWKKRTLFFPIRHFNSDTPVIPGVWKHLPYIISKRPLEINYGGGISLNPLLIGGGYFLWHRGKGIAIDPGHKFVYSLYRYCGIGVNNIHAIIITHEHIDHHADLETILTLRRGCTEDLDIYTTPEVEDLYSLKQISNREAVLSMEINEIFIISDNKKKYEGIIKGVNLKILPAMHWQRVRELFNNTNNKRIDENILLKKHFNAFGIVLTIEKNKKKKSLNKNFNNKKQILITGDSLFPICLKRNKLHVYSKDEEWHAYKNTNKPFLRAKVPHIDKVKQMGWLPFSLKNSKDELLEMINEQCMKMIEEYRKIKKIDIACLHIGSIEKFEKLDHFEKDIKFLKKMLHNPEFCYNGFHLGFLGSLRIMELLIKEKKFDSQKGLVILTEFGEELLGNRRLICETFSYATQFLPLYKKNTNKCKCTTLPSEVTLCIDLFPEDKKNEITVRCSYCGNYHDNKNIVALEGPGEIITFVHENETGKASNICRHP